MCEHNIRGGASAHFFGGKDGVCVCVCVISPKAMTEELKKKRRKRIKEAFFSIFFLFFSVTAEAEAPA